MSTLVTQINVRIPVEKVAVLLQSLLAGQKAPLFNYEEQTAALCELLERYGWSPSRGGDGSVQLSVYRGRTLDLAQDLVLNRLVGVVPA